MAPLSLKIILDDGAVTRTLMFDTSTLVKDADEIVREKILGIEQDKDYGFFLTSADDKYSGVWLEGDKKLENYILKDGDSLHYLPRIRNLRLRLLDGSVKTLQVDESNIIGNLMAHICDRIGISNFEEYGLCREDLEAPEESKPMTGTLTLKKKTIQREKDAKLEQLSKKLKTDDNVQWLEQHRTLRECRVDPKETLLFKRRLFYSDRNVDSRDPVQLNLLYVQTRDALLDGRQVVTEDKAAEFAGIQCQIQYGDFHEEKHKPGFIENLKEFLPEQYVSSWGVMKKITKEHRRHVGLSEIDAKHLYTKIARELPTYGVTFFLVKEKQKGKKKLVPRLLGINSQSILRLDEETKEILQEWSLTQVKSYRASSESFTLNFGDYSEKEYAVKTNDAFRIKDILQGYIDIIRKRLAAPFNVTYTEGEAMCEDMVEFSKGTVVQNIMPSKIVEHSLVGPSQIISVEQGQLSTQGTKIVTVHEIITTNRTTQQQRGEFNMHSDMSYNFGKKLNHLNSISVKAVVLLSDPTSENIQEVRRVVEEIEASMPSVIRGVQETAAKLSPDHSKKLLEELDELRAFINTLSSTAKRSDLSNPDNLMTAQDAAKRVADLSTQMYFSLDPKTKRNSKILLRTRNSFIQDEKTEESLRRASFLTASQNACQAIELAQIELDEKFNGVPQNDEDLRQIELRTLDKMGELNAAIALLLNAHADPKKVDYEMSVNSMKTIHEILPELMKDAKPLLRAREDDDGNDLKKQLRNLLERTEAMCLLTGTDDINKIHEAGNAYADSSQKLMFIFGRNRNKDRLNQRLDKENEIIDLAKDVAEKVSQLLYETNELTNIELEDPRAQDLDDAGVKCADATQGLICCTKLTASSIHQPHCRSALTAATENLSSSVQGLALVWKPLVEKPNRHQFGKNLADRTFDLAKALDRLKNAYTNLNDDFTQNELETQDKISTDPKEQKRLKFIITKSAAKKALDDSNTSLEDMIKLPTPIVSKGNSNAKKLEVYNNLSQKLAQLNAAMASLLQSTSDSDSSNLDTAEIALNTISKLMPELIQDSSNLHGIVKDDEWKNIMESLQDILESSQSIIVTDDEENNRQDINGVASKFANSSGKLYYIFNRRSNPRKEEQVLELSRSAVEQASLMLAKVYDLAENIGGEEGSSLDSAGVRVVNDAQQLLKTAEITSPSMRDSRCQTVLLSTIDHLTNSAQDLQNTWNHLKHTENHKQVEELDKNLNQMQEILDNLRQACQEDDNIEDISKIQEMEDQQKEKLEFLATLEKAKHAMANVDKELQTTISLGKIQSSADSKKVDPAVKRLMAEKLAQLNAALASLLLSTSDHNNPDYVKATAAIESISRLTPDIIKESKHLRDNVDDNTWKITVDNLKAMVDTNHDIYEKLEKNEPKEIGDAVFKLANSVSQLSYVFNPRRNPRKENQISALSRAACEQTSLLLSNIYQLADEVETEQGANLDTAGVKAVEAAKALLKTAEITAPNVENPHCQAALLSSVDNLSNRMEDLKATWTPLVDTPQLHQTGNQLDQYLKEIEAILDDLRKVCNTSDSQDQITRPLSEVDVSSAKDKIRNAEKLFSEDNMVELHALSSSKHNKPVIEQRLELSKKLDQLNQSMARLLQATLDPENPDCKTVEESITELSILSPEIIQQILALQRNLDDNSQKVIFEEAKALCEASLNICDSIGNNNTKELNEAATKYAHASGKLRYIISPRSYPNKEKQILDTTRSVCERTSLMLSRVSRLSEFVGGDEGINLDESGTSVAGAAQILLSNAQILAPSIDDPKCRSALSTSVDTLTNHAQDLSNIWMPLVKESNNRQIGEQLQRDLDLLLADLKKFKSTCQDTSDFREELVLPQQQAFIGDHIIKKEMKSDSSAKLEEGKRVENKKDPPHETVNKEIIIEDTPLRQLASKILESAKVKSESTSVPSEERKTLANFSNELADAIKALDHANAKSREDPLNPDKRQQLENVILNLQKICLLNRNKDGEQSYVVDLEDFLSDVTSSINDLSKTANEIINGNEAIAEIKKACENMQENAEKLLNQHEIQDENIINDMLLMDQYVQNCDEKVQEMKTMIHEINDENARRLLDNKLQILTENCDLLRFATKSSISSAKSVFLDESLRNLEDVENKIERIFDVINVVSHDANIGQQRETVDDLKYNKQLVQDAQTNLTTVIAAGNGENIPKAIIHYAVQMQNGIESPEQHRKLKSHVQNLIDLLKKQTVDNSRRVATWQDSLGVGDCGTTENIIQELQSFADDLEKNQKDNTKKVSEKTSLIKDDDIKNLLKPDKTPALGTQKELSHKFNSDVDKLNSMIDNIRLGLHKPEALARTLHTTSSISTQLASIARGLKGNDLVQNRRMDGAVQEMSVATYKLLMTAESLSNTPDAPNSRRRLLEACRSLNDSINNLVRIVFPADKLDQDMDEMTRNLQLHQKFLDPDQPTCALGLQECLEAMQNQQDVIQKLKSDQTMSRPECSTGLRYITSAVCNAAEYATHSAYLLSISEDDHNIIKQGLVDVDRLNKISDSINDTCLQIISVGRGDQVIDLETVLNKQVHQLQESIDETVKKVKEEDKNDIRAYSDGINFALKSLHDTFNVLPLKDDEITSKTMKLMDAIKNLNNRIEKIPSPRVDKDQKRLTVRKEITDKTRNLLNSTAMMTKKAGACEDEMMTWVMFGSSDVIKALESLISCIRDKAGETMYNETTKSTQDDDTPPKSFIQTQVDLANTWLRRPSYKETEKAAGIEGAETLLKMSIQMYEDLKGAEKEEMKQVIAETHQLLKDCSIKYNSEKASQLMERLKELRKMLERGVVTRVVEDFLEEPLTGLETLVTEEKDEKKRKFLLERKIAELLAQLGRVTKTARFVADTGISPAKIELKKSSDHVELLAPALVKAAQTRIQNPEDQNAIEHYQKLLAEYADSLSKVRELCDRAVCPIDFAQAAGETMQRIKEESTAQNDPQKGVYTSKVIMKLGSRVVEAGMHSPSVRKDPELEQTLKRIQRSIAAAKHVETAQTGNWRDVTAEIMRKTGEVESVLGGENIFQKQPEPDQPIFAAAHQLHEAVREWAARDNEVVAAAKRTAVHMARLSHYMNTDNKRELILTSKLIVMESREVAALAKKLALECSDVRIRTNLLQVCERIPTISGQLKMLTTVKGSSLGQQGIAEDKEAMNMLVGNAQNLMASIQEVVKAAASASVKIMSQRGYRMKWVRRNYY